MNYRKSIETTDELGAWYDSKYKEMGGAWNTPAEDSNRHLNDFGVMVDKSKTLLDVGCGGGHFLAEASNRVSCVGIELSTVGIEEAKKRAPEANCIHGSIETLDWEPFDYIVSMGSLEHIIDIDKALDNIRQLLKPDGQWYFYCPNEKWTYTDQPNERTMSNAEWVDLFQKHGLWTTKITEWGERRDNTAFSGTAKPTEFKPVETLPNFGKGLKLNIGSGQRPFQKPWINVDCQEKWNPDVLADANSMPMFDDGSCQMIVLHHVLEHFGCGESLGLLKECYRMLEPGGRLLIFVPDVRALAQRWLMRQVDDYIFFVNLMGAYMGDDADRHKWHYSFDGLSALLKEIGWKQVSRLSPQIVPNADVTFDWWIMSVEAIK